MAPLTALRQEAESLTEVELAHIAAVAIQAKKYPRAGATGPPITGHLEATGSR